MVELPDMFGIIAEKSFKVSEFHGFKVSKWQGGNVAKLLKTMSWGFPRETGANRGQGFTLALCHLATLKP
jgi:hypothetical protein